MGTIQKNKLMLSKNNIKLYGIFLGKDSFSNLSYQERHNKIYASFKNTITGENIIGITQSNVFNNMTIEQNSQKLYFHKEITYNDPYNYFTWQANDISNNYLLDVSVSDICYQILYNIDFNGNNSFGRNRNIDLYNYYKISYNDNNIELSNNLTFYITNNSSHSESEYFRIYDTPYNKSINVTISGEDISLSTPTIIYQQNLRENKDLSFVYKVSMSNENIVSQNPQNIIDEGNINILLLSDNYNIKVFDQLVTTTNTTKFILQMSDIFLNYLDLSYNVPSNTIAGGLIESSHNIITYTPDDDFLGIDNFTYYVSYKDQGNNSNFDISSEYATVTINVVKSASQSSQQSIRLFKYTYSKSHPLRGFCCKIERINNIYLNKYEYLYYENDILLGDSSGITIMGWLTPSQLPSGDELATIVSLLEMQPNPDSSYSMQNQIGVQLDSSGLLYFTAYDSSGLLTMYAKSKLNIDSAAHTPEFKVGTRQHFTIIVSNPLYVTNTNSTIIKFNINGNPNSTYTKNDIENNLTYSLSGNDITDVAFPKIIQRKFNTFGMGYSGGIEDIYLYNTIVPKVARDFIRNKEPCTCAPQNTTLSLDWNRLLKAPIITANQIPES